MEPRNLQFVFFVLLVIVIRVHSALCGRYSDDSSSSEEDSSPSRMRCTTIWGVDGKCTRLSECPSDQWSGSRHDVCFHRRRQKVVCCVSGSRHHRPWKAEDTSKDETREKWNSITFPKNSASDGSMNNRTKVKRISLQKFEEYMDMIFANTSVEENTQGRTPTMPGQYPHMSALGWTRLSAEISWKCGGNLISHNFVLTAAHCASVNNRIPDIVRIGDLNLIEKEDSVRPQTFEVKRSYLHPMYDSSVYYNDIGLVELSTNAVFAEFVRPACLWSEPEIPHNSLIAMGYGSSEFGGIQTQTLTELSLTVIPNEECNRRLPPITTARLGVIESQLCAIDPSGRTDTCQGDSGGPLQMNIPKNGKIHYHLVGITSYGIFCGGRYPSVYSRVSSFVDWVEQIVWPE